jgi:hypothetical protein
MRSSLLKVPMCLCRLFPDAECWRWRSLCILGCPMQIEQAQSCIATRYQRLLNTANGRLGRTFQGMIPSIRPSLALSLVPVGLLPQRSCDGDLRSSRD